MMRYLVDYYHADLLTHPAFDRVLEEMAAVIHSPTARKRLSALTSNYDRWDLLIESVVDCLQTVDVGRERGLAVARVRAPDGPLTSGFLSVPILSLTDAVQVRHAELRHPEPTLRPADP